MGNLHTALSLCRRSYQLFNHLDRAITLNRLAGGLERVYSRSGKFVFRCRLQLAGVGIHGCMPLAVLGIVAELDGGRANRNVMIAHTKETANTQDIAAHAGAVVSNVLDRPDVLVIAIVQSRPTTFELSSSLAGTLANVPPVFFADSPVLAPEACPFAPTVVTSVIEFGPMNIVTALPDLSVAWTRNEPGMTFTFVKPEFCRLVVTCC